MTGKTCPTPRTTETGFASSNSKIRVDAPSPFMTVPKKEVSPTRDDPLQHILN